MRTAIRLDLKIWKGADFSQLITSLQYKDGPAIDFSTKTVTAQIREHPDFNSTLIATFVIPSISDGKIYLTLTKAITAAITYSTGYYDMAVLESGFIEPWVYGDVNFEDVKTYTV